MLIGNKIEKVKFGLIKKYKCDESRRGSLNGKYIS